MKHESRGTLLRIFIDESDRREGRPLHTAIVEALRAAGFVGATVLKGIEGYGPRKAVHSARAADLLIGLPVLIEVIEEEKKILSFLPHLREMIQTGLLTLEKVSLVRLGRGES
jgi:PII-like signaling protein